MLSSIALADSCSVSAATAKRCRVEPEAGCIRENNGGLQTKDSRQSFVRIKGWDAPVSLRTQRLLSHLARECDCPSGKVGVYLRLLRHTDCNSFELLFPTDRVRGLLMRPRARFSAVEDLDQGNCVHNASFFPTSRPSGEIRPARKQWHRLPCQRNHAAFCSLGAQ